MLRNGAPEISNREVVRVRPLTLRQQLYAFFRTKEDGSQLVEMAMVAPILLVILTGMASFGMALYSQQQLGFAAANSVQAVATGASYTTFSSTSTYDSPCQEIAAIVTSGLPNWNTGSISYTLTIGSNSPYTWTGTSYPSGCATTGVTEIQANSAQLQPLVLNISYPYSWFPILRYYLMQTNPTGNLQTTQAAIIQ